MTPSWRGTSKLNPPAGCFPNGPVPTVSDIPRAYRGASGWSGGTTRPLPSCFEHADGDLPVVRGGGDRDGSPGRIGHPDRGAHAAVSAATSNRPEPDCLSTRAQARDNALRA